MIRRLASLSVVVCSGALAAAAIATPFAPAPSAFAQSEPRQVPFNDAGAALAANYLRLRPQIATAGLLKNGAAPKLKALGFATVVDLRGPEEGAPAERAAVKDAGLRYFNIPVTNGLPSEVQIADFARIVEDPGAAPLLIHCVSANRVGAMWALYRAYQGVPPDLALEEARTIGLRPDREADVRRRLAERLPTR